MALLLGTSSCAFTIPLGDERARDSGGTHVVLAEPDSGPEAPDPSDSGGPPCEVIGAASLPVPDATDAYYRDPIQVRLSDHDPSTRLRVLTNSGVEVTGLTEFSEDGTLVSFRPDSPLEPGATYRATAFYCDDRQAVVWAFTTSLAGSPLACSLPGTAFHLDLATARWAAPEGFGGVVPLVATHELLVGVSAETDLRVDGIAAPRTATTQDTCAPTSTLPTAERSGPDLSMSAPSATLLVDGQPVTISDWLVDATVLPDCSGVAGGRSRGTVDARELAEVLELGGSVTTPDGLCSFLTTYGTTCAPCASDGQPYCFGFHVEGITGTALLEPLVCVAEAECHPTCATSTCPDPTAGVCAE